MNLHLTALEIAVEHGELTEKQEVSVARIRATLALARDADPATRRRLIRKATAVVDALTRAPGLPPKDISVRVARYILGSGMPFTPSVEKWFRNVPR